METLAFSCDVTNGQVWSRDGLFRSIRYESGAATGGVTPTIRVRSVVGQAYDCEMVPGKTITIPEAARGIVIQNISGGAVLTGKISAGAGSISDNSVVGTMSLDAAALTALEQINVRPESISGDYNVVGALVANTPVNVITAVSNVSGAIIYSAAYYDVSAGPLPGGLIGKATAPANLQDGDPILMAGQTLAFTGVNIVSANLTIPQYLAPGKAAWFISGGATAATSVRAARWKLL